MKTSKAIVLCSFFLSGPSAFILRPAIGTTRRSLGTSFHDGRSSSSLRVNTQQDLLSTSSSSSSSSVPQRSVRGVRRMEKFARLPVWPAWNGALIWLVSQIFGGEVAAKLEDTITGRVCPNFYQYRETSPWIMLVHHCHTFNAIDPLRYLQRTFFPEGFPAHPHRGFITITYILHGGFVHRDSEGVRQAYGAERHHGGKHTQWLITGRGMLHEEMFDLHNNSAFNSRQELFQIWLNLPAAQKFDEPRSILLGGDNETPVVEASGSKTLILAGSYQGRTAAAPLSSELALFHVTLEPNTSWEYNVPSTFETAFVYLRKGSLTTNDASSETTTTTTTIPVHHTAYFEATGDRVQVTAGRDGADFMLLAGQPLREPCVASGSMVMTSPLEIERAYQDYQNGLFGRPWDHKLSDADWEKHVEQFRPRM